MSSSGLRSWVRGALLAMALLFAAPFAVGASSSVQRSDEVLVAQASANEGARDGATWHVPADIPVRRDAASRESTSDWMTPLWIVLALGVFAWTVVLSRRRAGGRGAWPAARKSRGFLASALPGLFGRLAVSEGVTPTERPKILSAQRLTPRHSLHVVRWQGDEWLLGCSETGISVLARQSGRDVSPQATQNPTQPLDAEERRA